MRPKRIVTSAAGSGHYRILSGLKWLILEGLARFDLKAVVSVADSGGDTGFWIRDEKGLLPPGDFAKCLVALSPYPEEMLREMFLTKFSEMGELTGHNPANMIFTQFHRASGGDPLIVLRALSQMFRAVGTILPVSLKPVTLGVKVEFQSGRTEWVWEEGRIDRLVYDPEFKGKRFRIIDARLKSSRIRMVTEVSEALLQADLIILGPGDLYTSVLPNLLVPGLARTIRSARAKVVYVCNLMTKHGETDGYRASDFVEQIESRLERKVDYLVCNNERPSQRILRRYAQERSHFVEPDLVSSEGRMVISRNLMSATDVARHNPKALALVIKEILNL